MRIPQKSDSLLLNFGKTTGLLFLSISIGLLLDSKFIIPFFPNGQLAADIIIILIFIPVFFKATKKVREFLIYAVLIAIAGECFFSLYLEMYTYRLRNVPIYVFFGHALLYVSVLYFCKGSHVKFHRKKIELIFTILVVSYATVFFIFFNDIFGFILTVLTLLILSRKPRERLFYLAMYLCVALLEIIGTTYQCWFWPAHAFRMEDSFLKSANPPSGISFFYFGLDLGSLYFYKLRHKIAWNRMKNIREMRKPGCLNVGVSPSKFSS